MAEISECNNVSVTPQITTGNVYAKLPVVLAELKVQIDMDTTIDFPTDEVVLEIKDVKKRVKLTQCRLLLPTNKLFLKGYVRKNIQYAAPLTQTSTTVSSNIKSFTVDVPFQCVTPVTYLTPPVQPKQNQRGEFEFFTMTDIPDTEPHSDKDKLLAGDLSQFDEQSTEYFNELPYCELISAHVIEYDEGLSRIPLDNGPFEEKTFHQVEEKMVVYLTLKVLQLQQLRVHSGHPVKDEEDEIEEIED
jgi:hypothetical protein